MDGPWQICHLSAEDYGKKALETAKIMRWIDPDIELVACGSSHSEMPTYPEWDRVVLEYLYDYVDYLSLHRYYGHDDTDNTGDFLASFADMDNFIHTIISTADYVKAKKRGKKTINLSFDEWNIWACRAENFAAWETAPPLLEQIYNLQDALVFGGLICTLLNHADRIKMACLAQLVNVIAPVYTKAGGPAIKQTIFYPFQQVSTFGRGEVLKPLMTCPSYPSKAYGDVPILQQAVVRNPETGDISVFILNCDQAEELEVAFDFRSFGAVTPIEHTVLNGPDLLAANRFSEPEQVKPKNVPISGNGTGHLTVLLPKLSWNMLRFSNH
jgi:alpha-N-arabinofuranosidase